MGMRLPLVAGGGTLTPSWTAFLGSSSMDRPRKKASTVGCRRQPRLWLDQTFVRASESCERSSLAEFHLGDNLLRAQVPIAVRVDSRHCSGNRCDKDQDRENAGGCQLTRLAWFAQAIHRAHHSHHRQ